ncbi:MAG: AAA family ATPase [Kiritimatiellaeota bacterium]|nr:AAA family ATPase [Kiritimatiellota bacterium]
MSEAIEEKKLNIDLTDYMMILRKRFFMVVFIFIAIVAGTYYHTRRIPPEFQSEAKIKLALRQPMATIQGASITWYGGRGNEIPSEIKLIKNKTSILDMVAEVLKEGRKSEFLIKNSDFFMTGPVSSDGTDRDDSVLKLNEKIEDIDFSAAQDDVKAYVSGLTGARINSMLTIEQIPKTNIVKLIVNSRHPSLSEAIANVLAVVYNVDYWRSKTTQAKDQLVFIEEQLAAEKKKLKPIIKAKVETAKNEAFLGSVDIYRSELTNLRIELKKLQERYTPKHPRVVKLKELIAGLEEDLAKIPPAKQKLERTEKRDDITTEFIKTLEELRLKANIDYQAKKGKAQAEIQVLSWATPGVQVKPNMRMRMVVGVIFGLLLGCVMAFVWEGLDTSIGKIEDVERITQLPVVAHIPLVGAKKRQGFKRFFRMLKKLLTFFIPFKSKEQPRDLESKILLNLDPMSVTAEAYRTLRTNLQFAVGGSGDSGNLVALTSTSPGEGKTLTSTNLAITLAQAGKSTLLLEGDMRRPRIAKLFKIDEQPGLSDVLIGTAKIDSALRTITDMLIGDSEWDKIMDMPGLDNLNILPCGTLPPNPTELLMSNEFRELMVKLKERYDYVIVDTPPTLPVSDAMIISTVVDGTMVIYQFDTTSRHLLLRAIQNLRKNQAKLLGVVINQLAFDIVLNAKSHYGYGYRYDADGYS